MAEIRQKFNKRSFKVEILILATLAFFGQISLAEAKESDMKASNVIKLVNESRREAGLENLIENPKLRSAAEKKAKDMIGNGYFSHFSPEGKSPWDFIVEQGYDYKYAGENLAIDYTNAKEQHEAWMDSELHRKNILSVDYTEIGVATVKGEIAGRKTYVTVQEFATPAFQLKYEKDEFPVEISNQNKVVAGFSVKAPSDLLDGEIKDFKKGFGEITTEARSGRIFDGKKLTVAGWYVSIVLAIFITIVNLILIMIFGHGRHMENMK